MHIEHSVRRIAKMIRQFVSEILEQDKSVEYEKPILSVDNRSRLNRHPMIRSKTVSRCAFNICYPKVPIIAEYACEEISSECLNAFEYDSFLIIIRFLLAYL